MTVLTPQVILTQAADLIERQGLTKNQYISTYDDNLDSCSFCVEGALRKVATGYASTISVDHPEFNEAEVLLADVVKPGWRTEDRFGNPTAPHGDAYAFNVLTRWNDDPERTQEEVVAALRAAAEDGQ